MNKLFRKSILRNRMLPQINLSRVELWNADISHSSFHYSDFAGTQFVSTTLYMTGFWGCKLQFADFSDADTTNTDFVYADLTKALITRDQLQVAYRLHGATLPNGERYDGSFNLYGDIESAKAYGIDITDPTAMASFYAMSEKELNKRFSRRDRPEYTDWGN